MAGYKFEIQEQLVEISVTRQGHSFHVEMDGRSVECRAVLADDSTFFLELHEAGGGRRLIHAAGWAKGDERQLWVDGQMIRFRRLRQQRGQTNLEGSLTAIIPAIVSEILVEPGDFVVAGEKLVLLESMKMIIPIQAPYDGVVEAINCRQGEAVQAGSQLINLVKKGEYE